MQGKKTEWQEGRLFNAGDYWKMPDGSWMGITPCGLYCNLKAHGVIENADDTITVSPSILVSGGKGQAQWHGYLENGVWKEC